jgi:cyclic pyranopterin phosphate synthase
MDFTHFDESGGARMVDVGGKNVTDRVAIAAGRVVVNEKTFELIKSGGLYKGDVLGCARVAGIMGAKNASLLIPMCHNINLTSVKINFELKENTIYIESEVKTAGKTGVEMEALTAVSVAALTIYDMCKAVQKDILIENIFLLKKTGGKSSETGA